VGASNFVNLGKLKSNNGNQNYNTYLPSDTDLSKHDLVLTWRKAFSVLFARAGLRHYKKGSQRGEQGSRKWNR